MSKDHLLDFYQTQLDDLAQDYKKVSKQLRVEQDGATQNKLERQIEQIGRDMEEWQEKIRERRLKQCQDALKALISILKTAESQQDLIVQSYRQTVSHWPAAVSTNAQTVEAIANELERITPGESAYTARDEFIATIIHLTVDPFLSNALNDWGAQYRAGIDWLQLYAQIQATQSQRLANAQPAILLTITRYDQLSTQSGDRYYRFNAWLIEDIETYQAKKTGYHSLLTSDASDAAPCLLDELLQRTTALLNSLLAEQRRVCEYCQNYPQIHVFLPLELIHLDVDAWLLNPEDSRRREYLGHDHVVVIRCANRYDGNYKKSPSWLQLWSRHQALLQEPAQDVFVPGDDSDLDELMDILDDAVQPDRNVVGLQISQPPQDVEELCCELLDSGLPLAVWPRCSLANKSHETQLADLLAACCLEQLPNTIKAKRYETRKRKNSIDCHIGHHLSLLWDDPYLVPPKSA